MEKSDYEQFIEFKNFLDDRVTYLFKAFKEHTKLHDRFDIDNICYYYTNVPFIEVEYSKWNYDEKDTRYICFTLEDIFGTAEEKIQAWKDETIAQEKAAQEKAERDRLAREKFALEQEHKEFERLRKKFESK